MGKKRRPRGQSQHRTVVRPFRVSRRRRCRLDATAVRANCVAAGIPFAGLKTLQGPVIYNCGEGNSGFVARLFAAGRRLGIGRDDSLPLFVLDEAPDFGHERCSSQCDRPGDVVRRPTARVGTLDMERARPWYHPSWCTWLQTPSPGHFARGPQRCSRARTIGVSRDRKYEAVQALRKPAYVSASVGRLVSPLDCLAARAWVLRQV
jgi:hypothetical protein